MDRNTNSLDSFLTGSAKETNEKEKLEISEIRLNGLQHTSRAFVERLAAPVKKAKTLGELNTALKNFEARLDMLGVISSNKLQLDADEQGRIVVIANLAEYKSRRNFQIGAQTTSKGQVELSGFAGIKNIIGLADSLQLRGTFGATQDIKRVPASLSVNLSVPQVFPMEKSTGDVSISADVFKQEPLNQYMYSISHGTQIKADVSPSSALVYSFQNRRIVEDSSAAAAATSPVDLAPLKAEIAEKDVLHQFSWIYSHNNIKTVYGATGRQPYPYTKGVHTSFLAAVGNPFDLGTKSSAFVKSECTVDAYAPLLKRFGVVANMKVSLGAVRALNPGTKLNLTERFLYERHRGINGFIGPVDPATKASLGGTVKASVLGRIAAPFPVRALYDLANLHVHGFVHASNLGSYDFVNASKDSATFLNDFYSNGYVTVGAGVFIPMGPGRVEINFTAPVQGIGRKLEKSEVASFGVFFDGMF